MVADTLFDTTEGTTKHTEAEADNGLGLIENFQDRLVLETLNAAEANVIHAVLLCCIDDLLA